LTFKNRPGEAMPGDPDALSGDSEVHSITDAATPHSEEMRQRMIKYAIAMGIRMVCLILIFVVDGWFKLVPALGAVFLPWVAVIIANGSDKAEIHSDALLDYVPMGELDAPEEDTGPAAAVADDAAMTLLQGELIDEEDGLADDEGDHGRAAS
jgi:predicted tellurium resistance membrane protein TerC